MKYKNICKGVEHVCKAYKLTILKEIGKPITPLIEVNSRVFLIKKNKVNIWDLSDTVMET